MKPIHGDFSFGGLVAEINRKIAEEKKKLSTMTPLEQAVYIEERKAAQEKAEREYWNALKQAGIKL